MAAPLELAVCADSAGQLWNCSVWDLYTGTTLLSYRGGNSSPRSLAVLNGEHLLGAQLGKNYINVWELQRKDQLQQKIVCPGVVTCLAASPNGLYIVAGITESIYLWDVSSGALLAILNRHFQDLTCICFTDDSSHFVSGGKDNLVLLWNLCSVLETELSRNPEPRYVWSRHTLPVTDIHCGFGGSLARIGTASLDQTVKLWEIASGELLLSILFDVGITSVAMDPSEYNLFCGGVDGNIFQVSLCALPVQRTKTFQSDKENGCTFKGHRNQVTCLSVSMDGSLLLSGSHDETVKLWDIPSKQCIRTVSQKGPVTNAFIMPTVASMFNPDCKASVALPKFSKHLQAAESSADREGDGMMLRIGCHLQGREERYLEKSVRLLSTASAAADKNLFGDGEYTKIRVAELEEEVKKLKKINRELYDFSTQILTKQT
ncbi:WD repeat-containing protein 18 [Protopterus annectens]|uniref:WD repeat-containing protein 18 n=1 Tax=Protopterus annectens TaxID=7888 RepID=UPI001CF9A224|nr:WD repeat-containing protein 18 [Protopterus annectens]